jgi:hypothetical protein
MAGVFRRENGQAWTSLGAVQAGAGGVVSYVDNAVTPGTHYDYELVVPSQQGAVAGGQVSTDFPAAVGPHPPLDIIFGLSPLSPNPIRDRFAVSFALTDATPARLDVVDVSGRRVATREVGALGRGAHVIDFGAAGDFAPGMYFVRLSHAGGSLTQRALVTTR